LKRQIKCTDKRGIVISIVKQANELGNTQNEKVFDYPFVIGNGGAGLYYLCREINDELERFVCTGKQPEEDKGTNKEYHVFTHEQERMMIGRWAGMGMTVTYHRQQVELVDRITIAYMKVENTKTGLSISIIPWFVAPGRPYPIFVYIYAIGHYQRAEKKSLGETAAAVRKLFGISGFHKSTVSRSLGAMAGFIDVSGPGQPLAAELTDKRVEMKKPDENAIDAISEILAFYPSFEVLEKEIGGKAKRLPKPMKRADRAAHTLGGIPDGQFEIIIRSEPGGRPRPDRRRRPPRHRKKRSKPVQRPLKFVGHPQREDKRKAIIAICRNLALDAAVKYHRFLI